MGEVRMEQEGTTGFLLLVLLFFGFFFLGGGGGGVVDLNRVYALKTTGHGEQVMRTEKNGQVVTVPMKYMCSNQIRCLWSKRNFFDCGALQMLIPGWRQGRAQTGSSPNRVSRLNRLNVIHFLAV